MAAERLDNLVVRRGLAETREKAQRVIRAGQILVDGQIRDKPGHRHDEGVTLEIRGGPRFVSMSDFPEDWAAMEALASELRHLAPMLAASDAPPKLRPVHDDRGVDIFTRVYKGDTFLIAVNPYDQWVTQAFEIECGAEQSVEVLFENRKARLAAGRFTDLFDPYAVHVYRIE